MDVFYICWKALLKESEKHQVFIWDTARHRFGKDHDFSIPGNRLEYVYQRGPLIINNMQNCVLSSITDQTLPSYRKLVEKENLNVCCLCKGPGLEALGFLLGFKKHIHDLNCVSVTVISPFEEWRDMSESLICENLYHSTTSVSYSPNSFDFFSCYSNVCSPPTLQCIQNADVIIMHKNCTRQGNESYASMLKDITTHMKAGALLFFMNNVARRKSLNNIQGTGACLESLIRVDVDNVPYDASLCSFVGLPPKTKGCLRLSIWERHAFTIASSSTEMKFKSERPSKRLHKKVNKGNLKFGSIQPKICKRFDLSSSSEQKLDVNTRSLFKSHELFSQPEIKSEVVKNSIYESSSSDLKEDLSTDRISAISSEMTVVKAELSEQKLEVNTQSPFKSYELSPQPKIKSEVVENSSYESSASDLKEDLSTDRISAISSEMTVVKTQLSEEKLDVNTRSLFKSHELFPQPKIKSKVVENSSYESSASALKEDLSTDSIPVISTQMTVVKSEPLRKY